MQPAIATAAMFFIFIGDFPPYKIYLPISIREHLYAGERIHILYRTIPCIGNRYAVFVTLLKRKYATLYQKCEYSCIFCTSAVDEVYILYFVCGRRTGLLQFAGRVVILLEREMAPLGGELPRKRVKGGPVARICHPATPQSPSVTAPLKGSPDYRVPVAFRIQFHRGAQTIEKVLCRGAQCAPGEFCGSARLRGRTLFAPTVPHTFPYKESHEKRALPQGGSARKAEPYFII